MKLLVTGATGFVGSAVRHRAANDGVDVIGSSRRSRAEPGLVAVGELGATTDWSAVVRGRDVVIHAAARVHVMADTAADPLAAFRQINVDGTVRLARQAAAEGVRRFVFISSIKVNGESTPRGCPFAADDRPQPCDAYGISKFEAEEALKQLSAHTGMELVIIRPPLVYGPGVRANFLSMMRWLDRGIPLPFAAVDNRRSLIGLDNLVDLILTCASHPAAANQTFLASDGQDLSTPDLMRRLAEALGRRARLVPVPPALLAGGARMFGKDALAQRLLGSLQVDASKASSVLGWSPPVSVDEGLRRTAAHFAASRRGGY